LNTLTRIPKRIKLPIYIISSLIFVLLQFRFAELVTIKLTNFLLELTDYHFVISTNTLDYLAVASIPFFGLLLFSKRKRQPKRLLIQDILRKLFKKRAIVDQDTP